MLDQWPSFWLDRVLAKVRNKPERNSQWCAMRAQLREPTAAPALHTSVEAVTVSKTWLLTPAPAAPGNASSVSAVVPDDVLRPLATDSGHGAAPVRCSRLATSPRQWR